VVYAIQMSIYGSENGPIKIGIASNFYSRLAGLQCSSPFDLVPLGVSPQKTVQAAAREEKRLFEKLASFRMRGEWFRAAPQIKQYIARFFLRLKDRSEASPRSYRLLTPEETKERLGISTYRLKQLVEDELLTEHRIGKVSRYSTDEVDGLVVSIEDETPAEPEPPEEPETAEPGSPDDQLMTPKQLAEYLDSSLDTVRRRILDGTLPAYKVGGAYRSYRSEIDAAIKGMKVKAP